LRFANLCRALGIVDVFGGEGDRSVETVNDIPYILTFKPKYVVLNIGRNDIGSGVSSATWQANYASIVSQLKAAGCTVIHLLPIPEGGGLDQSALKTYITTTYSGDLMIDPSTGWSSSYNSTDGVHPNAAGHRYIASLIINSGYIPASTQAYPEQVVFPSLLNYATTNTTQPLMTSAKYLASGSAVGTASPYNYGAGFNTFEISGSSSNGILTLGGNTTNKEFISGDGSGNLFLSHNNNGTLTNNINIWGATGNVTLNNAGDIATAQFNVGASTTKYTLPWTRMTTTQVNALGTLTEGAAVYDNVLHAPSYYNGTSWVNLTSFATSASPQFTGAAHFTGIQTTSNTFSAGSTTATTSNYIIQGNATSGTVTVNLPAANTVPGQTYIVKKIDGSANTVVITPNGTDTIDGAGSLTISVQYKGYTIQASGSAWLVVGSF